MPATQSLDWNEAIQRVSRMVSRLLPLTIQLQLQLTAAATTVRADPVMMDQVLVNLALNARDAMPDGGELRISTERLQKTGADYVRLLICDNGCGIGPENLARIFEPFFTTKEVGKGSGLGLATVHGIVEQHGGWIEVQSELDRGTRVAVFLPFESAQDGSRW